MKRRFSTIALVLLTGCARILGIDGEYVSGVADGSRSHATGDGSIPSGLAGQGGSGGSFTASGGVAPIGAAGTGRGGASGNGDVDSGAGGHPAAACRAGHYSGSFDGSHRPVLTVVGVPASISTGTLSFDLVGSTGMATIQSGKMDARLTNVLVQDAGSMTATLTGRFDCSTGKILGGQLSGQLELVNLVPLSVSGTWEGVMDAAGAFTGTWTEREPVATGADGGMGICVPRNAALTQPIGAGCGTWNARQSH